jgi:hypothetical protein
MALPVRFRRGLHKATDQRKRWSVRRLGPIEQAMSAVWASGMALDKGMPDGKHFPG